MPFSIVLELCADWILDLGTCWCDFLLTRNYLIRVRHHVVAMETTDMRTLSRDARHERRVQVIRLRNAGRAYEEIATQTGLSHTGAFDICNRHDAAGAKALRDAHGGSATHRAALWHPAVGAHDGVVLGALGLHAAKTDEEGLRTVARSGQEVAR